MFKKNIPGEMKQQSNTNSNNNNNKSDIIVIEDAFIEELYSKLESYKCSHKSSAATNNEIISIWLLLNQYREKQLGIINRLLSALHKPSIHEFIPATELLNDIVIKYTSDKQLIHHIALELYKLKKVTPYNQILKSIIDLLWTLNEQHHINYL
jgi:hypothetical protein